MPPGMAAWPVGDPLHARLSRCPPSSGCLRDTAPSRFVQALHGRPGQPPWRRRRSLVFHGERRREAWQKDCISGYREDSWKGSAAKIAVLRTLRGTPLNPALHGGVAGLQAALVQELFHIAEQQGVPKIPPDRTQNELGLGLPPLEDLRSGRHPGIFSAYQPTPAESCSTSRLRLRIL